jgi:tetratricopeptide (TPR) repeat protein
MIDRGDALRSAGTIAIVALLLLLFPIGAMATEGNRGCKAETAEAWRLCGDTARLNGDYTAAIAAYDEALRLDPEYEPALTNRGISYRETHDYKAALRDFTEVIRLNPQALAAYNNRASTYAAKGDVDAAVADLRECLRLEPNYADAHYNLGTYLFRVGRLSGSVAAYTDSIQLYAEAAAHPPSARVSGWFNEDAFYARASAPGSNLRNIDLYLADAYYWRGQVYLRMGEATKASSDLAAARAIDPDTPRHNEKAE